MVEAPAPSAVRTLEFPRFGTCTFAESDIFVFPWGLPGFDNLRTFVVLQLESQNQIFWLQSLDDTSIALPLADPYTFFPDYDPTLPGFSTASLGIQRAEDFTLLAVIVGAEGGRTFMNLMAPILINLKDRVARQVPLENSGYTVAMEITVPEAVQAQAEAPPA